MVSSVVVPCLMQYIHFQLWIVRFRFVIVDAHINGQPAYCTTYPVRDFALDGSSIAMSLFQRLPKAASAHTSNECSCFGFNIIPLD